MTGLEIVAGIAVAGMATKLVIDRRDRERKAFGKRLEDFKKTQKNWAGIPVIFLVLCERIEKGGLEEEGVFRVCGATENIEKLKKAFDSKKANKIDISEEPIADITSLLKLWLRELPDPLISYEINEPLFRFAEQGQHKDIHYLRQLLKQMPQPHRLMLMKLLQMFAQINRNIETTKMTPENIAVSIGTSIFRNEKQDNEKDNKDQEDNPAEVMAYLQQVNTIMAFLIIHQDELALDEESTFDEKAAKKARKEREKLEKEKEKEMEKEKKEKEKMKDKM